METYLVRLVPPAAVGEQLGAAVDEALQQFGRRLPHEESLQVSNGWRKEHGFISWRQFAKNAIDCSISKTEKGYTFRKGEWDGRGFGPAEGGKLEFPLNTPAEQLGAALISLMRGAQTGEKWVL